MNKLPSPKESEDQIALFQWAALMSVCRPELKLLYHVPNGGSRDVREARRLKAQGVKPGVPDICLPVARGDYHGLYIELKRRDGGTVSENQKYWCAALNEQGYLSVVCHGFEDAVNVIERYLHGKEKDVHA